MLAFHTNWTTPFFSTSNSKKYYVEDFEILTTILSALKWRQYNGSIKMVTDNVGACYYKNLGIEQIWDLGIDTSLTKDTMKDIDPFLFWAAGKIYALSMQQTPCVMIDTDFIVWQSLIDELSKFEVSTIHNEAIYDDVYPYKDKFYMKPSYEFDSDWDWSVLPCNTAFTCIANTSFKDYYTYESIRFMKNVVYGEGRVANMVFAEQRMISMCAKKMGIEIHCISDLSTLATNKQNSFTHTWGYKDIMRNDFSKRNEFCIKCIARIIKDFPEYEKMISEIDEVYNYYLQYKMQ